MDLIQTNQSLSAPAPRQVVMDLNRCIDEWLDEKYKHSTSKKTHTAYQVTITEFRDVLQSVGLDLDSEASAVSPLARRWCDFSKRGIEVAPTTFNQRRAILSSFFEFAILHEVMNANPAKRFNPRKGVDKHAAHPIAAETVKEAVKAIDTAKLAGKRDKALLALSLTTGRRVSEIANLKLGNLTRAGKSCHVLFERCKGNVEAENLLDEKTTAHLYTYLDAVYGGRAAVTAKTKSAPGTRLWLSCANRNYGEPVSPRTLERIAEKYLDTSKFHALRHTMAVHMHDKGANLAAIGRALNHKNLKTTSDYLDKHLGYENEYAKDLAKDFGF